MSISTGSPDGYPSGIKSAAGSGRSRGFTLLEVLVAFAVLAVSLAVVFQIFSTGMRGSRDAESYARAVMLAESTLERFLAETPIAEQDVSGELDDGYAWSASARPLAARRSDNAGWGAVYPLEVVVTVAWGEPGRRRSVSLATLRLARRDR